MKNIKYIIDFIGKIIIESFLMISKKDMKSALIYLTSYLISQYFFTSIFEDKFYFIDIASSLQSIMILVSFFLSQFFLMFVPFTILFLLEKNLIKIVSGLLEMNLCKLSEQLLTSESQVHFEELSEEILNTEENRKIAQLKIWRLLVLEMWLENVYAETIWFPYISKVWLFVETQIIGIFSGS